MNLDQFAWPLLGPLMGLRSAGWSRIASSTCLGQDHYWLGRQGLRATASESRSDPMVTGLDSREQAEVWANYGSWWWTGRPGVLQSMGSQGVRPDWATELNWTRSMWGLFRPRLGTSNKHTFPSADVTAKVTWEAKHRLRGWGNRLHRLIREASKSHHRD